jgi:hypothetical protein
MAVLWIALVAQGMASPRFRAPFGVGITTLQPTRRHAIAAGVAGLSALPSIAADDSNAYAKVGSERPGNNYYFPMARYRYCPRILRAWIAVDELAIPSLKAGDWEGLDIVAQRMDDATTAMPLFTSSVEGARSTKRKKKSETQVAMAALTKRYTTECAALQAAVNHRDEKKVLASLTSAKEALGEYRKLGKIDGPDGGMVVPENTAEGRGGVPDSQYVVPVFSGGAAMNREDFRKLRKSDP